MDNFLGKDNLPKQTTEEIKKKSLNRLISIKYTEAFELLLFPKHQVQNIAQEIPFFPRSTFISNLKSHIATCHQ